MILTPILNGLPRSETRFLYPETSPQNPIKGRQDAYPTVVDNKDYLTAINGVYPSI